MASSLGMDSHRLWTISPSLISFLTCGWELALAVAWVSLGSNQTFFLPQWRTLEASLFRSLGTLMAVAAALKGKRESDS